MKFVAVGDLFRGRVHGGSLCHLNPKPFASEMQSCCDDRPCTILEQMLALERKVALSKTTGFASTMLGSAGSVPPWFNLAAVQQHGGSSQAMRRVVSRRSGVETTAFT